MKNIILTFITLLFLSTCLQTFGQQNKFDIGIVGGPNRVWLQGNDFIEKSYKPLYKYSFGASFQYNFVSFPNLGPI